MNNSEGVEQLNRPWAVESSLQRFRIVTAVVKTLILPVVIFQMLAYYPVVVKLGQFSCGFILSDVVFFLINICLIPS